MCVEFIAGKQGVITGMMCARSHWFTFGFHTVKFSIPGRCVKSTAATCGSVLACA